MAERTILVVEDDPAIRRGLVDALKFGGYSSIACGDGEEGLGQAPGAGRGMIAARGAAIGKREHRERREGQAHYQFLHANYAALPTEVSRYWSALVGTRFREFGGFSGCLKRARYCPLSARKRKFCGPGPAARVMGLVGAAVAPGIAALPAVVC